jgi:hypothetical protein
LNPLKGTNRELLDGLNASVLGNTRDAVSNRKKKISDSIAITFVCRPAKVWTS